MGTLSREDGRFLCQLWCAAAPNKKKSTLGTSPRGFRYLGTFPFLSCASRSVSGLPKQVRGNTAPHVFFRWLIFSLGSPSLSCARGSVSGLPKQVRGNTAPRVFFRWLLFSLGSPSLSCASGSVSGLPKQVRGNTAPRVFSALSLSP